MAKIFISYRRATASGWAVLLQGKLKERFGAREVFLDTGNKEYGTDFDQQLKRHLAGCEAMLVLIEPGWLDHRDEAGRRRLEDPADYVRREIEAGLSQSPRVVPVYLDGALVPAADQLPESLRPLVRRHALMLRAETWQTQVRELGDSLRQARGRRLLWVLGGAAVVLVMVFAASEFLPRRPIPPATTVEPAKPSSAASTPDPTEQLQSATTADPTEPGPAPPEVKSRNHTPSATARDDAKPIPATVPRPPQLGPQLRELQGGQFLMGSPPEEDGRYDNEAPRHPVEVGAFALAIAPVTRAEYAVFVADTGHVGAGCWTWNGKESMLDPQADWHAPGFPQDDTHPVVCVNWDDAQAYVKWLSKKTGQPYRLPTEAEWEYAARAGSTSARYWGDDVDQACGYANVVDRTAQARVPGANSWTIHNCSDGYAYTAPANFGKANGFGLRGMLGNVWQWTEDCWHDNYRGAPVRADRAWGQENGGQCGRRVVRGGSWFNNPWDVRAAVRGRNDTSDRSSFVGFRVARTLP